MVPFFSSSTELGIAVMQKRQVRTVSNCALWTGLTCPLLCMSRSSTSLAWRRRRFPWSVFPEILQLQYIDKVIDVCCAGPWCAFIVGDSRDPTVAARFSSGQVVDIPVVFNDRLGVKVLTRWSISLLAVIDTFWTSCVHAATSALVLEVPQFQIIARAGGHSVVQQRMVLDLAVMAAVKGPFLTHFASFFALLQLSRS